MLFRHYYRKCIQTWVMGMFRSAVASVPSHPTLCGYSTPSLTSAQGTIVLTDVIDACDSQKQWHDWLAHTFITW